MKNRRVILGVFLTVLFILSACSGNESYEEMQLDELKDFISEKRTGFILFTFDKDDIETNREQVTKALEKNDQTAQYFNYREQVSNEQSTTFQKDIGTKQSKDSLGYYEDGVLMAEFESPNDWSEKKIEDLNKFISQISN